MTKPSRLKTGDKVAIVSLSSGILGESFIKHELDLGIKRLEEFGLTPVFMPNSLKGLDFIEKHPEARADDLKQAFADKEIKAVICAIGGNDTFRTLPFLMNDEQFKQNVKNNPKIFLGYSDSTTNHLMFQKLGLNTFYGQAFVTDLAEFEPEMLAYSKNAFEYLFNPTSNYQIKSSEFWFKDRTDFSPAAVGTLREKIVETNGYELLQGSKNATGELLGGCIEILGDHAGLATNNFEEIEKIRKESPVFPTLDEWTGKIMFIETSEQKLSPENYRIIIQKFKELGVFGKINGLLVGKPIDEAFYEEYKQILKEELKDFDIPVLYNLNFGHSYPHAIIPYGALAEIDVKNKTLTVLNTTIN